MITIIRIRRPAPQVDFPSLRVWTSNNLMIEVTRWSRVWWVEIFDNSTGRLVHKNVVARGYCSPRATQLLRGALALLNSAQGSHWGSHVR